MMSANKATGQGLAIVDDYYRDYGCRVRELKGQGERVIGYLSVYVPLEMIAAAGLIPFRIKGDVNKPITKVDAQLETIVCPFVRSALDLALKGSLDFLDGLVIPHSCDSVSATYPIWKDNLHLPFFHFVNVPHKTGRASIDFFRTELDLFRKRLEGFTGKVTSDQDLSQAIGDYSQNRAKMRELYDLRKSSPPLISGVEMTKVLVASMSIPVNECTELLSQVIEEVKGREPVSFQKSRRIMVIGSQVDDIAFIKIIEDAGAHVVIDDLSIGTKVYWPEVDMNHDPVRSLAVRYLEKIKSPRTYREKTGTYPEYLEERFGHIGRFIREYRVDGVILYIYRYCDPYGLEVPVIKGYIESLGIPLFYVEDEYSMSSISRLKTRIQAFLEVIG